MKFAIITKIADDMITTMETALITVCGFNTIEEAQQDILEDEELQGNDIITKNYIEQLEIVGYNNSSELYEIENTLLKTKTIKLNDAIMKEIEAGAPKTVNIITYLLTIEGVTTNKTDINKTALKDLIIDNMKPVKVEIDTWNNTMVFELEEIQQFEAVENIKVKSACNISNYKMNGNKTIGLTKDNKVVMTNDYNNNGVVNAGIEISNNKSIFYLLTTTYCNEAIKELFTIKDIKEYEQIKRIFNITINKPEDIEYINFVKEYVKRGVNNA